VRLDVYKRVEEGAKEAGREGGREGGRAATYPVRK
jgi:hypothetical protein